MNESDPGAQSLKATPLRSPPWWYERLAAASTDIGQPRQPSGMHPLLRRLELGQLKEIAHQRGWRIEGASKADLAGALAPLLEDPTEIARTVTSLPQPLRAALRASLVAEDGSGITATTLATTISALDSPHKPVEAAGLLLDLARRGLLIPLRDSSSDEARYLFPWEIQRNLPPLPGWCRQSREPPGTSVLSDDGADLLAAVVRVWEQLRAQPRRLRSLPEAVTAGARTQMARRYWSRSPRNERPRDGNTLASSLLVTPPFLLGDADVDALADLTDGDQERLELVCRLLCELDLASCEAGYLLTRPEVMNHFLRSPALARHVVVTQAYASLVDWNEMDTVLRAEARLALRSDLPHVTGGHGPRSQLAHLRQMLLRFLATAGEEGWCALEDVEISLRSLWPALASNGRSDGQTWPAEAWRLVWRQDGREPREDNDHDWQAVQGRLLRIMLEGPLHWLGLVDLSRRGGDLVAFRAHGLFDRMWDRCEGFAYGASDTPPMIVDTTNLTMTIRSGAIPAQAHAFLGRISRLEETTPSVFVYRLDQRAAYSAFEQGTALEDLLATWSQLLPVEMPEVLRDTLATWWSEYGQIHLYEGLALLELGDDFTLRELEASTALTKHVVAKLSPRLVLVPDRAVPQLLQEFAAKGLMPREVK